MDDILFSKRVIHLNDHPIDSKGDCVIYWMQRSQRASGNLALKYSAELANDLGKPLLVYFGLFDQYPMGSARAFQFMLENLAQVTSELHNRGIGFVVRREHPAAGVARAAREFKACAVVVDEDYLKIGRTWRSDAASKLDIKLIQIDAETIVPARTTDKEEWGAYTLRPKILRVLDQHMVDIPDTRPETMWRGALGDCIDLASADIPALVASLNVDQQVPPTRHFTGGLSEALSRLNEFIEHGLPLYGDKRNDIGVSASSDLSPYLHFGQISPLRVALAVRDSDSKDDCVDAFLEQIIVRRGLAINFCLYNDHYDSLDGAADWARKTLEEHKSDPHEEVYSLDELESARTHDDLWNAAQTELVRLGKIHPYMRMVWAKKILEWSESPEDALARTIYLNDKYALDGRDPNGYANIAWCIYGKHDRPFATRRVFGNIRYMSSEATKRKTHWQDYVQRVGEL